MSVYNAWKDRSRTVAELAVEHDLHRDTVYKYIRMGKQIETASTTVIQFSAEWLRGLSSIGFTNVCDAVDAEFARRNPNG